MLFTNRRLVMFVGGYGSGKTEVAVNYTLASRPLVPNLSIVDLDVVNPYFRSRERVAELTKRGVQVIAPAGEWATADLPALPPEISGGIQDKERHLVLDVGGDDVGARALGRYQRELLQADYEMWVVVNACRPFSQNAELALSMLRSIEVTSRMRVTGLVNNTNLMQYTDLALIERGEQMLLTLSDMTGLPIVCTAVVEGLVDAARAKLRSPVLPLHLYMKRPWE